MADTLRDMTELDKECEALTAEMERLIAENASRAMDQDEYRKQYGEYEERYNVAKKRFDELQNDKKREFNGAAVLESYAEMLRTKQEVPLDFDENIWGLFVDHATVSADRTITFFLKTGKQMTEEV